MEFDLQFLHTTCQFYFLLLIFVFMWYVCMLDLCLTKQGMIGKGTKIKEEQNGTNFSFRSTFQ